MRTTDKYRAVHNLKGDYKLELKLPKEMVKELQTKASNLGFSSIEEFIYFVLEEVLEEIRNKDFPGGGKKIGEQEQKEIKAKLQDLGYM